MLQIRLSKASSSDGDGSKPAASVSCPDYLVLADLPVAKALGGVYTANAVKLVGRRSRRQVGAKVHFCVRCNLPIAIYGRLSPCEHTFCLTCARSDSSCYLCDERIQKIQSIKMLEGIFICAAPHCFKSFLKRMDFESHLIEIHLDLLQCIAEKDELHEKDAMKARPVSSDPQPKKLSSQLQRDQSKGSSGTQQQDQEQISRIQTQHKQLSYNLQHQGQQDYQVNSGDNSLQLYQEKQQEFEKSHHQSLQEKRQKHTHGEKHRKHHDKRQEPHTSKQYQQEEGPRHEDVHQMDTEHQTVHVRQPQKQVTSKPESPPVLPPSFSMQPLQYPYPLHSEGFQQHYNPHYNLTQSITFLESLPIQTGLQNFQSGNQGMSMQVPPIQDFHENHFRPWHLGPSGMPHEAATAVHALQEGSMAPNTQGQFSHFATNYLPDSSTMALPPPPLQGMGMGLDQPVHYQDSNHGVLVSTPHKRDKYMNMYTQAEDAKEVHNHRGRGGRSSSGPNHG